MIANIKKKYVEEKPERDVAMKRQPGVVEAKSHEWKQEIHLWVYVVVVTLMFLESWWWSQYYFFFCLLLVILATVFPRQRHACWPLTINTIWWWWKRPVCWSGASCPWCPFGSLHCCHPHPFCRNDVQTAWISIGCSSPSVFTVVIIAFVALKFFV